MIESGKRNPIQSKPVFMWQLDSLVVKMWHNSILNKPIELWNCDRYNARKCGSLSFIRLPMPYTRNQSSWSLFDLNKNTKHIHNCKREKIPNWIANETFMEKKVTDWLRVNSDGDLVNST